MYWVPRGFLSVARENEFAASNVAEWTRAGTGPQFFIPPTSGVAANGLPIYNWDQAAAQIDRDNASWSATHGVGATVTYAFRSTAPGMMPSDTAGFSRFSTTQIVVAEEALRLWADVANITFVRVDAGDGYSNSATILFGNYSSGEAGAAAFAYFPGSAAASSIDGDVWINISLSSNMDLTFGGYGQQVIAHEVGHAIGLDHPGDYNGGTPEYPAAATYWQDSRAFSIMSYFGSPGVGFQLGAFSNGPQFHDIAAAQLLYGPSLTTRTGDTIYGFNSTAGHAHFGIMSGSAPAVFSIWDGGGNDTLDLSGYSTNSDIDLRAESFSSAGPGNPGNDAIGNISIARGVTIENGIGGSGNDTIIGNSAANILTGNGGDDTLAGGVGADQLVGGAGMDSASYAGAVSAVMVDLVTPGVNAGEAAGDTYISIENLIGSAFADTLVGDGGANTLIGGAGADNLQGRGGSDTLSGGDGDDQLNGGLGGDVLDGGDGFDTVRYDGASAGVTIYVDASYANTGEAAGDTTTSIEGFVGSAFNDYMVGGVANNVLQGFIGNDILEGHDGNDLIDGGDGDDQLNGGTGGDIIDGGAGFDTARYDGATSGVTIYVDAPYANTGEAAGDFLISIEGIVGSTFNDYLVGGAANNVLQGYVGNDILEGHDGNDLLDGGDGNDQLNGGLGGDIFDGGAGFDTARYDGATIGVIAFMTDAWANTGEAAGDAYISIEALYGSNFNDTLGGSAIGNELQGLDGADVIYGYGGNDFIGGGNGNDVLEGGTGIDTLNGGAGDDQFVFRAGESVGDVIQDFTGNAGNAGDTLLFIGYGTTGATFIQVDATHWMINSADGAIHDTITLINAANVDVSDYIFGG